MIEATILAAMLIWIITQLERVRVRLNNGAKRMNYFNHKITAIEGRLKSCGIVLLEGDEEDQDDLDPPPEVRQLTFGFNR